ncbi:MAG: bis(5'-nucleosyl)-tetraphosphatase (symmetrical) YqeK [bacterium]
MKTFAELLPLIRQRLEANGRHHRFRHVEGVIDTAALLAHTHGADVEKAKLAALLHDSTKQDDPAENRRRIALRYGEGEADKWPPQLWHGLAAAQYAQADLGIDDPDILNAIENHSAGRPGMSKLEKIIFVADYVEPYRKYDNASIRKAAFADLDLGVALVLQETDRILAEKGWARAQRGDAAWAEYRRLLEE